MSNYDQFIRRMQDNKCKECEDTGKVKQVTKEGKIIYKYCSCEAGKKEERKA